MNYDPTPPSDADALRRRAEEELQGLPPPVAFHESPADVERLIQELQIHQIELHLQNEELRDARVELERSLARYTDLYDFAPISFFTLGRDGTIAQMNLAGAAQLGRERARLLGVSFASLVEERDRPVFTAFLGGVFTAAAQQSCEVALGPVGQPARSVVIEARLAPSLGECRCAALDITDRKNAGQLIQTQLRELERWRDVTLGREERIQALKVEVNEALTGAGRPARYTLPPPPA